MPELVGVENIKKLVMLGVEMGNVADKIVQGGGVSRWGALMDLADEAMALTSVDFSKVDDEYKDLSDAEREQILAEVKVKFDIADDKIEGVVEGALGIALKLEGLVKESIALAMSLKEEAPSA